MLAGNEGECVMKTGIFKIGVLNVVLYHSITYLIELEADNLIIRTEYPQIPPKVEYSLSERGKSLMKVLDQLCLWGEENKPKE